MTTRRDLIIAAGTAAAVLGAFRLVPRLFEAAPEFEPLGGLRGFRRLSGGEATMTSDPLLGLDIGRAEIDESVAQAVRADPCRFLHDGPLPDGDVVPVASFSDYFCPYCRVQTRHLAGLAADPSARIAVTWHEWPVLGGSSALAARAALAAKRQGAYPAFQEALLTSPFRPSPVYLAGLADRVGIDPDRLLADMEGPDIAREIETSTALARLLGFFGTPAMVVGRTAIQGEVSNTMLQRLIAAERDQGWRTACAGG